MTIRHMQIFLEVYRQMSITKAAERLHMTQPAVTRAVQEIEHFYGVRLFERLNRRLYITQSGQELYAYALHITDTFDVMEKSLMNWDEIGIIRVGASITIGNYGLPGIVKRLRAEKPGLRVHATIANGARLEDMLLDNALDVALIEGAVDRKELMGRQYALDRLVLIVPQGHALLEKETVVLADLLGYDMLLREQGSAGRAFLDRIFAARGFSLNPVWESVSTQALVRAVAAGLGISLLPAKLVDKEIREGQVQTRDICDVSLERALNIVWHRNKYLTAGVKRFMELVGE